MRYWHARNGGTDLVRLVSDLPDGFEIRMMAGREPLDDISRPPLHVSLTVGRRGEVGSARRASDEEVKAALEHWREELVEDEPDGNLRHFWEKE
jgi:hypothetical protein